MKLKRCNTCKVEYSAAQVHPHRCNRSAGPAIGSKVKPAPGQLALPETGVDDIPRDGDR